MVFSLKALLLARARSKKLEAGRKALAHERSDARELKRLHDELKLAREKAKLQDLLWRNRIF